MPLNITDVCLFHNCRKNLCVQRWIQYLTELDNNNRAPERNFWLNSTVFFFFFTKFVTDMGVGGRRLQNTLTAISPNGATRCLISWHQAINYTKVATTNFCAAVLDDKWNVQAATSEKLPSFFRGCVSLTLMMCNSLQLHLTCALNGSTNCTPRVMKKKTANQAKKSTVCTVTSHVST